MMSKRAQTSIVHLTLIVLVIISTFSIFSFNLVRANNSNYIKTVNNWSEDIKLTDCSSWFGNGYASRPTIGVVNASIYIIYENSWGTFPYYGYELGFLKSLDGGKSWTYKNLTNYDGHASSMPNVCVSSGNIYVVWQDYRDSPGCPEIYFKNSSDNGRTWGNDTALTSNDGYASEKSNIFVVNNSIYAVWEDTRHGNCEIYFRKGLIQENGTITWESENRVTTTSINTGNWNPCVYVTNATIHLVFHRYLEDTGKTEIFYMNSTDDGKNWSSPQLLSTKDSYHSYVAQIVANNNILHVVWQDDYYGVVYRDSTNSGDTWNDPVYVVPSKGIDPQIVISENKTLYITYWTSWEEYYKSYYIVSYDNGDIWQGPYLLSNVSAYSPQLAVSDGYVHVVFVSDRTGNSEIYYKRYPKFNDPPEIKEWYPLTNVTITELQNQLFYVNATDPNDDTLFYQWCLNDSLLVNETNSSYLFVPDENSSGDYTIKVVVSDGNLTTSHTWTVTVINIKKLQVEINVLQDLLEQLNENYTNLLNTLTLLGDDLASFWLELNSSELNNTELQTKLQGLNENLSALKNQLALSNQNITVLQNLINNLNQTLDLSNEQIATLWNLLNQSIDNETEFRNLIAQLNQSINSLQGEIEKLKEENEQIVREREAAEERLMIAAVVLIGVVLICILIGVTKKKK